MAYEDELAKVWMFSRLERDDLKRIGKCVVLRKYKKGDAIVTEGDRGVAFYMVISGKVSMTKEGKSLGEFGAGGSFGEMSLLDGYPRSATLTAMDDTECLVMTGWDFTAELRANPNIGIAMLPELSKRIRRLEGEHIP